ncbi:MAG: RagB/SusD family nutrient uptake outer membrane protein [Prevotellaceae bacterium]|nr:RagB/SusD family nutrient uptake outer membrane protein [Prevotellaceae bacterium]
MKLNKFFIIAFAGVALTACNDIDEIQPAGSGLTQEQVNKIYESLPVRAEATFSGMFTMMGKPGATFDSGRAEDFGFIMMAISQDAEAADYVYPNSGYNWFSVCGEYSSRNPDYANPYIRYAMPYNQIKTANDVLKSYEGREDADAINHMAQCRAIRAFDYLALAPYYQYKYVGHENELCVPLVTLETTDFANNPRATVKEVYDLILEDLNYAVENLSIERDSKARINKTVALGLRARAYMNMEKWAEAAADASAALDLCAQEGLSPATIDEVSTPSFYDINDHNWVWGFDMTENLANKDYATCASWESSFSANGYAAGVAVYACINNLLYNKISDTDVRKGWWVDDNLHSPLLSTISWNGVSGDAISTLAIDDIKLEFFPYTNVKFGLSTIGGDKNDADFPFMRVEELILIKAESLAKSGNEGEAKTVLSDFVKNFRDPAYNIAMSSRSLADEIWFQRRVELWGEGFGMSDVMRLGKPVVRFHEGEDTNQPDAFRFNVEPTDPWLLLRFCTSETNTNASIIDNEGGVIPVMYQNGNLRDGVTD